MAASIDLPAIVGDPDFPAFAVAQALALIAAAWIVRALLVRRGIAAAQAATRLTLAFAAGALLGGAALGLLLRLPRAVIGRVDLFAPGWPMAYGALAGAAVAVALAARFAGVSPRGALDAAAPAIGVLVAIGRLGCFVAGCCFGKPSGAAFAVTYPPGTPAFAEHVHARLVESTALRSAPVHPAPLYEAAIGVAMIAAAFALGRAKRGAAFAGAAIVYAAGRFAVEIARGDPRPVAGALSLPQWLSVAVVAIVVIERSRAE